MLLLAAGRSACDICLQDYNEDHLPHFIPCGHSFCYSCIPGVAHSGSHTCPFCRAPFDEARIYKMHVDFVRDITEDSILETGTQKHHANCNLCRTNISGQRYKCATCPDFDSCESCFPLTQAQHKDHTFVRVRYVKDYLLDPTHISERRQAMPEHMCTCNNCGHNVVGVRYRCTDDLCPDYDLCEDCEPLTDVHPPEHIMLKVRCLPPIAPPPPDSTVGQQFHAMCDYCHASIVGVRYKCMHPDCPDFDLCIRCEAAPIPRHSPLHPLLKIRRPDAVWINGP